MEKSLSANDPIEEWREAAEAWVDLDSGARLHEEGKTTFLEQLKQDFIQAGDSDAAATRKVKTGDKWRKYLADMVLKRTEANKAKVRKEYLERLMWRRESEEANIRLEKKLVKP